LNESILESYQPIKDELLLIRRHIHAHSELGWHETETTSYTLDILRSDGVKARRLESTGVIADFEVEGAKEVVALYADIDALPIAETSRVAWSSENAGVAHACGHDFHAAAVLGVGLILVRSSQLLEKLCGRSSVRLVFQPTEELNPSGSPVVIQQGGLDDVSRIYAPHVEPKLDVGKIGVAPDPVTSAANLAEVRVRGASGHTSRLHLTVDVVYLLSSPATTIPLVFCRVFDPRNVVGISWGSIRADSAYNAISKEGVLLGTVRTTNLEAWKEVEGVIKELINSIVQPLVRNKNAEVEVNYTRGVPPVINDIDETKRVENAVVSILGQDALFRTERSLGSEDFSWYLQHTQPNGQKIVGAMSRLGVRVPKTPPNNIHQSNLVIDEKCLDYGVTFLTRLLYEQ
jgi:amidohydrolase